MFSDTIRWACLAQGQSDGCIFAMEVPPDHPLFWDELPEDAESDPNYAALLALAEESTPEERAANFKTQGNKKLQVGLQSKSKLMLREAIKFYGEGLKLQAKDEALNSVLLSNRAHVESLLGNWRNALSDALMAKKTDPSNAKAYYRAAKAALQLGINDQCCELCLEGQAIDPSSKEFPALLVTAREKQGEEKRQHEEAARRKREEEEPARRLAAAIVSRGWQVTLPQVRIESSSRPSLDDEGLMHWPVLILYPVNMQQDAIEDFAETDSFSDHLDVMFGPSAPPLSWDQRNDYCRDKIELYFLSYAGSPLSNEKLVLAMQGKWPEGSVKGPERYGPKAAKWKLVDESLRLGELLALEEYVIPGIPLFFAVARGSVYREKFLQENLR